MDTGCFPWTTDPSVIPGVQRGDQKYIAVRSAEQDVLHKMPQRYWPGIQAVPPIPTTIMLPEEAKYLNSVLENLDSPLLANQDELVSTKDMLKFVDQVVIAVDGTDHIPGNIIADIANNTEALGQNIADECSYLQLKHESYSPEPDIQKPELEDIHMVDTCRQSADNYEQPPVKEEISDPSAQFSSTSYDAMDASKSPIVEESAVAKAGTTMGATGNMSNVVQPNVQSSGINVHASTKQSKECFASTTLCSDSSWQKLDANEFTQSQSNLKDVFSFVEPKQEKCANDMPSSGSHMHFYISNMPISTQPGPDIVVPVSHPHDEDPHTTPEKKQEKIAPPLAAIDSPLVIFPSKSASISTDSFSPNKKSAASVRATKKSSLSHLLDTTEPDVAVSSCKESHLLSTNANFYTSAKTGTLCIPFEPDTNMVSDVIMSSLPENTKGTSTLQKSQTSTKQLSFVALQASSITSVASASTGQKSVGETCHIASDNKHTQKAIHTDPKLSMHVKPHVMSTHVICPNQSSTMPTQVQMMYINPGVSPQNSEGGSTISTLASNLPQVALASSSKRALPSGHLMIAYPKNQSNPLRNSSPAIAKKLSVGSNSPHQSQLVNSTPNASNFSLLQTLNSTQPQMMNLVSSALNPTQPRVVCPTPAEIQLLNFTSNPITTSTPNVSNLTTNALQHQQPIVMSSVPNAFNTVQAQMLTSDPNNLKYAQSNVVSASSSVQQGSQNLPALQLVNPNQVRPIPELREVVNPQPNDALNVSLNHSESKFAKPRPINITSTSHQESALMRFLNNCAPNALQSTLSNNNVESGNQAQTASSHVPIPHNAGNTEHIRFDRSLTTKELLDGSHVTSFGTQIQRFSMALPNTTLYSSTVAQIQINKFSKALSNTTLYSSTVAQTQVVYSTPVVPKPATAPCLNYVRTQQPQVGINFTSVTGALNTALTMAESNFAMTHASHLANDSPQRMNVTLPQNITNQVTSGTAARSELLHVPIPHSNSVEIQIQKFSKAPPITKLYDSNVAQTQVVYSTTAVPKPANVPCYLLSYVPVQQPQCVLNTAIPLYSFQPQLPPLNLPERNSTNSMPLNITQTGTQQNTPTIQNPVVGVAPIPPLPVQPQMINFIPNVSQPMLPPLMNVTPNVLNFQQPYVNFVSPSLIPPQVQTVTTSSILASPVVNVPPRILMPAQPQNLKFIPIVQNLVQPSTNTNLTSSQPVPTPSISPGGTQMLSPGTASSPIRPNVVSTVSNKVSPQIQGKTKATLGSELLTAQEDVPNFTTIAPKYVDLSENSPHHVNIERNSSQEMQGLKRKHAIISKKMVTDTHGAENVNVGSTLIQPALPSENQMMNIYSQGNSGITAPDHGDGDKNKTETDAARKFPPVAVVPPLSTEPKNPSWDTRDCVH